MIKAASYIALASIALVAASPGRASAAQSCFPVDRLRKIADLDFNDRVFISPDRSAVLVEDKTSKKFKIYAIGERTFPVVGVDLAPARRSAQLSLANDATRMIFSGAPSPAERLSYPVSADLRLHLVRKSLGASELRLRALRQICVSPGSIDKSSDASQRAFLRLLSRPQRTLSQAQVQEFVDLLASGAAEKDPAQTLAALHGLLFYSGALYEALLRAYPQLRAIKGAPDRSALTKADRQAIKRRVKEHVFRAFDIKGVVPFGAVKELAPLVRIYFKEDEKEEAMDTISYAATQAAADIPGYRHIFAYKVWAFAYDVAGELFKSTDTTKFTDLTLARSKNGFSLTLLGSEPLAGTSRGRFGFFHKRVRTIPFSALRVGENRFSYEWLHAGRRYRSLIDLTLVPASQSRLSPAMDPPQRPDARLKSGMVVVSHNMENSLVATTRRQYMRYFRHRGFTFSPPVDVANSHKLLASRIAGTHAVDYLIKEAHSDGHENTLFDLAKKGLLIVGRRKGRGEMETIEILYPVGKKHAKDSDVSNVEFGALLRRRERAGRPPLIYMNASCWSVDKAVLELSQANTPELIEIPTTDPINTFEDKPGNTERIILDGIRHREPFADIRAKLRLGAEYASGRADGFLFPDEAQYKARVQTKLTPLVQSRSRIFVVAKNGALKRYVPDGY
ncbi:MAG TPA: hypothetical protein VMU56_10360 [Beijerinckiaceae bacterium]|nr:hypothetical protein [Beijerinckiaceae bacterium]HVB89938.1 hypothetical protein [Beijerinckiaceae bacterium]